MASKLKAVTPKAAEPSKPKILVFGKAGVGKTWGAIDFPSCYYVDSEGGANLPHYTDKLDRSGGVYMGPDQGSTDFAEVINQVRALTTERHPYRTLVIDSITKLYALEIAREAERLGDKDAFGASKKPAVAYMRSLVAALMRLDMNVILIAHEKEEWGKAPNGQREVIGGTFDAWDKLSFELHLALHIQKQGQHRIARVVKSRLLEFPDASTFPWSYEEFAERYGRDVMEKGSAPIELATPAHVAELTKLLDAVKMPDGWVNKCLTAAGVDTVEELDAARIVKMINSVREKRDAV